MGEENDRYGDNGCGGFPLVVSTNVSCRKYANGGHFFRRRNVGLEVVRSRRMLTRIWTKIQPPLIFHFSIFDLRESLE